MKIPSSSAIRDWDNYTIQHEPISSIDLMERAARACVEWMEKNNFTEGPFHIFCGKGNNGGDGLAIARLLADRQQKVTVHILEFGHKGTEDFQGNLARLHQYDAVDIRFIQDESHFPALEDSHTIIDALFGTGLNRGLEGVTANLVAHINRYANFVLSIDMPGGLASDQSSKGQPVIRAQHTLSFQVYKTALLAAENAAHAGEVHILDIKLHPEYYRLLETRFELIDGQMIKSIFRNRDAFSHKGNFGHALLIAGSFGKIGAALLAARSCARSGAGLLTCHIPSCGYDIMQLGIPEAMVLTDFNSSFCTKIETDVSRFDALGIGPGLGTATETRALLRNLFDEYPKPMVIDADALNMLGMQKELLKQIPPGSILSPHPKEFQRMFGDTANEFERMELAMQHAAELDVVIVVKGHHTFIAAPHNKGYFNSTGNAGMATGGSGDVLTGILTSLLAQGYPSTEAAVLGVYLHGLAGDIAAAATSKEAMIAGDITSSLGSAFKKIME